MKSLGARWYQNGEQGTLLMEDIDTKQQDGLKAKWCFKNNALKKKTTEEENERIISK